MIITVCNYDTYQHPENYESNTKGGTTTTRNQQPSDTINKNEKNDKKKEIYMGEWNKFVEFCNKTIKLNGKERQWKALNDSTYKKFVQRRKAGFDGNDFANAVRNAMKDTHHKESNYKWLTPEFFTRTDKLNRYANL